MSFHMQCALASFLACAVLWTLGWWLERRDRPEVLRDPDPKCVRKLELM